MKKPTDAQIQKALGGIIADGFNRSLGVLDRIGVVDMNKLQKKYTGMGSEYYDLVTEQIEYTARYGAMAIRKLFDANETDVQPDGAANPQSPSAQGAAGR